QSGIFNFTNDSTYFEWNTQPHTQAEILEIMKRNGSIFEPGSQTQYSNSNYVLMTFILEKVYNQTLDGLLQSKITQQLGRKYTYIVHEINRKHRDTHSYQFICTWV